MVKPDVYDGLTEAQTHFLKKQTDKKLFTGSRQVGHTESIVREVIKYKNYPVKFLIIASQHRQGKDLMDRIRDYVYKNNIRTETNTLTNIKFSDGLSVQMKSSQSLSKSLKEIENYDTVLIDNVDYIDEFNSIGSVCEEENIRIVAAGTPHNSSSQNIPKMIYDDSWYVVHDTMESCEFIGQDKIDDLRVNMSLDIQMTEIDGKIVTDPSEKADYS